MTTFPRAAGLLLHPTSLPGAFAAGDFSGARRWIDFLHSAGVQRWQMLPLVPPGPGGSPYSTTGALALHPDLLDVDALVADGLLSAGDARVDASVLHLDRSDFDVAAAQKKPLLARAAAAVLSDAAGRDAVAVFAAAQTWVTPFARFSALKAHHHGAPWWQWDKALHDAGGAGVAQFADAHAADVQYHATIQFLLDRQWSAIRQYAKKQGVTMIGDVPIYVDRDSADVWSNRALFALNDSGEPLFVAGVPPDAFSDLGQLWGNPLYAWDVHAADQYRWWTERLGRACALYDAVRIDHFRAFAAYWAVPAADKDARGGAWVKGPGRALFDAVTASLGPLPLIAEDLGVITPDVEELRDALGLPGMKVLQFAWGQGPDAAYLPHNHVHNAVVYTGTHDNNTSLGFWNNADEAMKDHIRRYFAISGDNFVWDFIQAAMASVAHTAVVPMQDVLCLDAGARMNTPATAEGNWRFRVRQEAFHPDVAARLRALVALYGRLAVAG